MSTKTVQFKVEVKNIEITSGQYQVLGTANGYVGAKTAFHGDTFSADITESDSEYYAVIVLIESYTKDNVPYTVENKTINLMATLRLPAVRYTVKVCPESSIASIYTFARMTTVNVDGFMTISGTERNMKIAYGMKHNFYRTEGAIGDMIQNSPNGFETNSYSMFNSLCNLLYYCLTDTSNVFQAQFLDYACGQGTLNTSSLMAVRSLLQDPFTNANEIYQLLVGQEEVYENSLTSMEVADDKKAPNNWTLTLKSNDSGSKNFLPSGLGYVVFDADDNAWIGNNFRAGGPYSATHGLVYRYNATPASFSPIQGGGLLGVGFGTAVSPDKKHIAFGNFGWDSVYNNPQEGSISIFSHEDGKPISPPNGIVTDGLSRVQGMSYDTAGHLWMGSIGCQEPFAPATTGDYPFDDKPSAVVVYLNGDPTNMLICDTFPIKRSASSPIETTSTSYLKPFDVFPDNEGNAYVSCIGTYFEEAPGVPNESVLSAVYKVGIEGNSLVVKQSWFSDFQDKNPKETGFESFRQVAMNGNGDVVVVGVESSKATVLKNDLSEVVGYYDINTYAPWGVKIDQQDTVFLANFGRETGRANEQTLDMQGPFGVTMLRDSSDPASAQLLTVPTGGSEVMLANGFPLYGTRTRPVTTPVFVDGEPTVEYVRMQSYEPLMRLTSTNIDGAGNLWCMNNWKPSARVDTQDNPGGDGPVIFIGIAEPE